LPDRHFFVRIASLTIAAIPKLLLAAGLIGLLCSSIYCGLVLVAASSFARKRRSFLARGRDFFPKVSLLKPLYGDEPELESRLEGFFAQDYPSYEILFCARDHGDAGLRVARRVAQRYPHVPVQFLTTGAPAYTNAKVSSLELMGLAARSEILVISDSDVRVGPSYLREVAAPFADPIVGLVTCLYRGVSDGKSLWSKLEATAMSVEMAAGVLAAEWIEGMQFALGPTMAVRRSCVEEIGGFGTLGRYCADDFVLGRRIAANGHKVVLSHHVIDHIVLNESFSRSLQHQVRWMKSTRFSRPMGHLGTALTFSVPFGLLVFAMAVVLGLPQFGIAALAWSVVSRMLLAAMVGGAVVREGNLPRTVLLYPLRDLMGFGFWVASYGSNKILWRGEIFELLRDGVMRRYVPEALANPIGEETLLPPRV
jgi:ceramide glucosyltransferase